MDLSIFIVSTFLTLILIYGLFSSSTDTFKKYAVGDNNFKTSVLIITLLATKFGGKFLFSDLQYTYTDGLYYIITIILPLDFFIVGQWMAHRMKNFLPHLSVAESMGFLFGRTIRIITAISGILQLAGFTAIQFHVIAQIINLFCGVGGTIALYVAMIIVLCYTMWGGIKAVSFTDIIQFVTFSILIPVLLCLVGKRVDTLQSVATVFTDYQNFNVSNVIKIHPKFGDTINLLLMRIIPGMSPAIMQRFYMASNVKQVKNVFTYSALISFILRILIIVLAVLLVTVNPNLHPTKLIDHIMIFYPSYWVKSFVCIGMLALAMSTADSCLNTSSILFAHDIAVYLKYVGKNKLLLARLFTLIMGGLSILLALYERDFLQLAIRACSFYEPIVTVPFLMAIFGFRPSRYSVLLGMGAGTLTVIGFKYFGWGSYLNIRYEVLPAMIMNFLFLIGSYYMLPKVINKKDK